MLIADRQQSESVIYIDIDICSLYLLIDIGSLLLKYIVYFFRFLSQIGHYRVLSRVPCAKQ